MASCIAHYVANNETLHCQIMVVACICPTFVNLSTKSTFFSLLDAMPMVKNTSEECAFGFCIQFEAIGLSQSIIQWVVLRITCHNHHRCHHQHHQNDVYIIFMWTQSWHDVVGVWTQRSSFKAIHHLLKDMCPSTSTLRNHDPTPYFDMLLVPAFYFPDHTILFVFTPSKTSLRPSSTSLHFCHLEPRCAIFPF